MRIVKGQGFLAVLLVVALIASAFALALPVGAAPAVKTQMVICVDASNSISDADWALMKEGLARAVEDPTALPQDGSVELGINKFGWAFPEGPPRAEVVVPMTVVDSQATADAIAAAIRGMEHTYGWTPTGAAIKLAKDMMMGSPNWEDAERHIINLSTDGAPALPWPTGIAGAREQAIAERDAAIAAGITGIHAELLGEEMTEADKEWMRANLIHPEPGVLVEAPDWLFPDPDVNGFAVVVESYEEYEAAIREKLKVMVVTEPTLKLEPLEKSNPVFTNHQVVATLLDLGNPVEGETIAFEIISGPNAGLTGSAVTGADGKAYWDYTDAAGVDGGVDTIVARHGDDLESNPVTKTWRTPSVPGVGFWGIMATVVALGVLGVLTLHRRLAYLKN